MPKHIYITGASNGGMMTYRMLIEKPDLFVAGAAFIANLPKNIQQIQRPSKATPIMIANGTDDPIVKWEGGQVGRDDGRGELTSTLDTLSWWQMSNRVKAQATQHLDLPNINRRDRCQISLDIYNDGNESTTKSAPVWLYTVKGGGHAMPSIQYDAASSFLIKRLIGRQCKDAEGAELAWRFFKKY
jgi:polyhydroxybutyrate depolymerase